MNHEHEQSRASSPAAAATHNEAIEPGQSSRSALLRKPEHPMASGLVQRKARDANGVADGADHAVSAASSSNGSPLPDMLMRRFESSLGADLSGVRVHTGGASERAANAVGAKAYTMGNDIHFGAGHYDPSSSGGQHLLAHEVAHTVQQTGGIQRMQFKLEVSSPGDSSEHEADRAADAMVSGRAAAVVAASQLSRLALQRQPSKSVMEPPGPGMIALQSISKEGNSDTAKDVVTLIVRYPAERTPILEAVQRQFGDQFANEVRTLEQRDSKGLHLENKFIPTVGDWQLRPTIPFATDNTYDNAQTRFEAEQKRDRERAAARHGDAPYVGKIFRGTTPVTEIDAKTSSIVLRVMEDLRRKASAGKADAGSADGGVAPPAAVSPGAPTRSNAAADGGAPAELRLEIRRRVDDR